MKLESSNDFLQTSFEWAMNKAKTFIVTGTENGDINKGDGKKWFGPDGKVIDTPSESWAEPKNYGAAFWAGYYDRTAYYIRDYVHQAAGAAILGMNEELYQMFYTFASNASEKTGWYAPWAFNFDHSVYYMDTPNYNRFVREITSQFELVELCFKLYLYTGDRRYIDDEKISLFVDKIMTDFIDNQDGVVFKDKNGIPEGKGDIFKVSATYNERGFCAVEAGDSIASMYQAMLSYSKILDLRGEHDKSQLQLNKAKKLREYFNNDWSVIKKSDMYCYAIDKRGRKHYKWKKRGRNIHGGASLLFIPMKQLTYPGERNDKLLDYIFDMESSKKTREDNIESLTYLPNVFFPYRQSDRAWFWMTEIISQKDLPHEHKTQGTNGDYPEISFTFVSHVIEGLMGISVNTPSGEITINPCLPDNIDDITLTDYKFGKYTVDISVSGGRVMIKNKSSDSLLCNAVFYNDGKETVEKATIQSGETVRFKNK